MGINRKKQETKPAKINKQVLKRGTFKMHIHVPDRSGTRFSQILVL